MKKKLLNQKNLSCLALLTLCFNVSFGQQTIGEFPMMDGGFEAQSLTTLSTSTSNAPHATNWSISSPSTSTKSIVSNSGARSGSKYVSFTNSTFANGASRLQSPIAAGLASSTSYTVQYYYKTATNFISPTNYLTGSIYFTLADGSSAVSGNGAVTSTFAANTWVKATATFNSGNSTNPARYAGPRFNANAPSTAGDVLYVDDFVVYAGPVDNTAPDAPSAATVSGLDVSWTAPESGVDGGGYVVVRYATAPAADNNPNQNGIYAKGITFTSGVNLLQGTVVYIGTDTSFTDDVAGSAIGTDFYKVYTADKAFNYSSAGTLKTNQWSVNNPIDIYPNPVKDNQFTISLPASISGKVVVGIYNMSGQQVYKTDVAGASNSIVVCLAQSLKAGVYVVKVENSGKTSTQKITVR